MSGEPAGDRSGRTDVVVVGAGFTGLAAAHELKKAGVGFVLIEARDRVGGRAEAMRNGLGEWIDSGGQFLCDDMPEVLALARSRGKALVEAHVEGAFVAQPPMAPGAAERTYAGAMAIRERMNAIAPGDPAIAGMSVAAWLELQDDAADAKAAFRSMIEGLWCQALENMPLWHLIDNDRRITNEAPELQYFPAGTMHSLARDLADDLGGRLRLGTAATRIERGPDGVRVVTDPGDAATAGPGAAGPVFIEARAVLVAVPPMAASRIVFSPPLPAALAHALQVWRSGAVIKALARYRTAFWRGRGLSGMVMWRDLPGLFACDVSRDEDHAALVVFIGGPLAERWSGHGQVALRAEVTARLVEALGPEAGDMLDFTARDWTDDRWSGGGYSDLILDMEATDAEKTLLAGAPPVYFASSELSPSFPGYVEGAIVAGRLAAGKIIASLAARSAGTSG